MSQNEKPTAAFVLSLIAGIFILINGVLLGALIGLVGLIGGATGVYPFAALIPLALLSVFMAVGVIFGVLVLLGAFMVYRNPAQKTAWGVIILVFSILSIAIGGGFIIGFILGIIGGALTLAWKPKTSTAEPTTAPATPETTAT